MGWEDNDWAKRADEESPAESDGPLRYPPLFPNRRDDQDNEKKPEVQPWLTANPQTLRIIAGVIAIIGASIGLVSRIDGLSVGQKAEPAPIRTVIYGVPTVAALRAAEGYGVGAPRNVCTGQIRPKPDRGAWHCINVRPLNIDEIGAQALDSPGPCTHREASDSGAWRCLTRIATPKLSVKASGLPWIFGDIRKQSTVSHAGPMGICMSETRTNPNHGAWHCLGWHPLSPGVQEIQALDPGGPCLWREADEPTGIWICNSQNPVELPSNSGP
jgi:hypothetical protein